MNRIERRVRAAINPVSTALTGWWCHSAMRHMLTGHGPTARRRGVGSTPSAEQMKARAAAIDELLRSSSEVGVRRWLGGRWRSR
jgi:hypothetical protein